MRVSPWLQTARTSVVVVLLAALPTALLMTLSYRQCLRDARADMRQLVSRATFRINDILRSADRRLKGLIAEGDIATGNVSRRRLDTIVYEEPYFREVGIIDPEGRLILTNFGPIEAPTPVPPQNRPPEGSRDTCVVGLIHTLQMNRDSISICRPTTGKGAVNLLVDPRILTGWLDETDGGVDSFLVFALRDGRVLASMGEPPVRDGILGELPDHLIRLESASSDGQIRVVSAIGHSRALRHWYANLYTVAPILLLSQAALILLTIRALRRRSGLDHDLRLAMERNELRIAYQPVIDLRTDECVGAEALLRWKHPENGNIRPDIFIPIAEQTGQILPLTRWVMRQAAAELKSLMLAHPGFDLAVNIPAAFVVRSEIASLLAELPADGELSSRRLILEVTERDLLSGPPGEIAVEIGAMKAKGVRFALDDFGTGYSNLAQLNQFHAHILKIDRSFLPRGDPNGTASVVLGTLIELGRNLNLEMIAEGVETQSQADDLAARGVHMAQGWLWAPAMPIAELEAWLREERTEDRRLKAEDDGGETDPRLVRLA